MRNDALIASRGLKGLRVKEKAAAVQHIYIYIYIYISFCVFSHVIMSIILENTMNMGYFIEI